MLVGQDYIDRTAAVHSHSRFFSVYSQENSGLFVCFVMANFFEANHSVVIRQVIRLSQRNQAFFNFLFPGKFHSIVCLSACGKTERNLSKSQLPGPLRLSLLLLPVELKAFKLPVRRSPTHLHCCFVGILVGRPPEDAVTYY